MSSIQTSKMTNFRWVICALLFLATTVNYMDRQVLSLTWKDFIAPEFHWTDDDYGTITGWFSIFYAIANLFAGKFIDWMGTKKGYLIAIFVWSTGAVMHAGCGWVAMQIEGYSSIEALRLVQRGSDAAVAIATVSVWLFLSCRLILALGEAGNFPAAIKVTAEYFPKKDRAFSTSIFNSGASIGALAAPATIPLLARAMGWEMAFVIIGVLGYVWMGLWIWLYDKPNKSQYVNQAELNYIEQDSDIAEVQDKQEPKEEKTIGFLDCFTYRQTWSFIVGKFMTDGVWWFFLFWAPAYFSDQYGYTSDSTMAIALIFTLYAITTILSIGGGYLPTYFVDKKGMNPYIGRMRAMLIFACFPLLGLFAQPAGEISPWCPAIIIGLLGAGHQAWSANLYSTIGDMFPKSTIATITGIGAMAGGLGSFLINKGSGMLFTYAEGQGSAFSFLGFEGKPAGYMIVFCICAVAYLIGWIIMKILVPKYKPIIVED
ncbi:MULTISPECIES: MFS transporter [Segatella]|jgi:ACS family hexuronate transporter-like MFS transporter|nr:MULTISPECIES: MFS transporter [Segatella]MBQ3857585.1 MFS transporter [Prevotella sp.]MDR4931082.1 MFS transporter [Segatella bryantii]MEE3414260.1 MFS transporter [Prevotella sp.]OYP53956.1 MFS transporter [Segatella bryantii]UKK72859.1 MFS transporter [Segatella bryantii]